MKDIYIVKSDGTKEKFSDTKLRRSLQNAGADRVLTEEIVTHIKSELIEGISSSRIYDHAKFLLKKKSRGIAARYSLKRAIAELGPSGFPFEKFIAEIFKSMGYKTKTGQILKGGCISHEVDVIAENENELVIVEAKFHNQIGTKSDSKVPMYVKSRIEDLKTTNFGGLKKDNKKYDPWIVTNTKFTKAALDFGACVGLNLVDWNQPRGRALRDLIDDAELHPITAISSLSKSEIKAALLQNIVLAKDLLVRPDILKGLGISEKRKVMITNEVRSLIGSINK
jgi:hypothetical protein